MKKVITFGEIMLRLATQEYLRFSQSSHLSATFGGGEAEKVAVPANMVLPVPEGLSMAEAAAIPEVFATSYLNLFIEGRMKPGDTVFIQAGASGLGMAAIKLAKNIEAKVITTVGSKKKQYSLRILEPMLLLTVNRKIFQKF